MSSPGPLVAEPKPSVARTQPGLPHIPGSHDNPFIEVFAVLWFSTPPPFPCSLLDCPRRKAYEAMLRETIQVLEATRRSFKSHQLQVLRERIMGVLQRFN